jgi:hypothetical protein
VDAAFRLLGRSQLDAAAGALPGRKRTPVTLAPPVPNHTAWTSHSCRWSDMAETSTPYPRSRTGRRAGIMGHGSAPGTQQHQGAGWGWAGGLGGAVNSGINRMSLRKGG